MKLNDQSQIRYSVILSYAQMAMAIIIQILYTPYALRMLGDNEYGLLQTAISTVAMLSVLSLGFNSSYIRYYSRYKQSDDTESIYKLNGLFILVFGVLGTLVLICGVVLSFNLELVFDKGLTPEEYRIGRLLLLIITVNLAQSFPRGVFANIISAHQKFVFLKAIAVFESVGGPVLNFIVLFMGFRSVAIAVSLLSVGLMVFLFYAVYTFKVLKQKFIFKDFEKGLLKSLFMFTSFIMINIIVDQINTQAGKVILARFCGTAVVAVYTIGMNFSHYYTQFSTAVSGVFAPKVHKIVLDYEHDLKKQREMLTGFFTKVGRIQFAMLALVASGFVFFGQAFLRLWVGEGYDTSYYVAIICMLTGTIPLIQNVGIEIQRAENMHHYRSVIYGIIAVLNIGMSVYLSQSHGALGVAVATGISGILGQGILMNIVYHTKINIDMLIFWKNILRQLLGMVPALAVGALLMRTPAGSWLQLALWVLVYCAVYCGCVWFLSLNKEEKGIVLSLVNKVVRRR